MASLSTVCASCHPDQEAGMLLAEPGHSTVYLGRSSGALTTSRMRAALLAGAPGVSLALPSECASRMIWPNARLTARSFDRKKQRVSSSAICRAGSLISIPSIRNLDLSERLGDPCLARSSARNLIITERSFRLRSSSRSTDKAVSHSVASSLTSPSARTISLSFGR